MINNIGKKLTSRLARNIYFWIVVVWFMLGLNTGADEYERYVYLSFKLATTTLLFLLTVVNNFIIIPHTLAKKRYLHFIILFASSLLVFSGMYVVVVKFMLHYYPLIKVYEVSLITSPVNPEWTISNILYEIPTFAFGLGLWAVTFTMAWFMNSYAQQEKHANEAKQKQLETELRFLRNQVSPHFLFNTLNNIYGLSLKKSEATPESILKLSSLMRYMLYDANANLMPLDKEKEVMQAYIDMELLRLTKKEQLRFEIEADDNYNIPPLLWLPVLENAFKYATRVISDSYFINYSFVIKNKVLHLKSSNSYKEQKGNGIEVGGLGLDNLRKRLDILYPNNYSLNITKEENVYSIDIKVKLA